MRFGIVSTRTFSCCRHSIQKNEVTLDADSLGNVVKRDFGIQKENYQCAKIMSSPSQYLECIKMMNDI